VPNVVVEVHHARMRDVKVWAGTKNAVGEAMPRQSVNTSGKGLGDDSVEIHLVFVGSEVFFYCSRETGKIGD